MSDHICGPVGEYLCTRRPGHDGDHDVGILSAALTRDGKIRMVVDADLTGYVRGLREAAEKIDEAAAHQRKCACHTYSVDALPRCLRAMADAAEKGEQGR